jgi:hypothetical protein
MANITLILGTDSVSSSRVTINDNFSNINAELADIAGVLDTANETITLAGAASFGTLNVASGKLTANNTSVNVNAPLNISGRLTANADVKYSIRKIGPLSSTSDLPAANAFLYSTYVIDSVAIPSATLNVGDDGQEITIISAGGTVNLSVTNISGVTQVSLPDKATVTLRFVDTVWHIISANSIAAIQ